LRTRRRTLCEFVKKRNKWFFINDEMVREEELPDEAGFYFMVYNLTVH